MLLRTIYIMTLEHPGPGFNGMLSKPCENCASIYSIGNYIIGYMECARDVGQQKLYDCWLEFGKWLAIGGHIPPIGWQQKIVDEHGDFEPAIDRFIELLYEFLRESKPNWFVEFNLKPQRSKWGNCYGPRIADIRKREHVLWVKNA